MLVRKSISESEASFVEFAYSERYTQSDRIAFLSYSNVSTRPTGEENNIAVHLNLNHLCSFGLSVAAIRHGKRWPFSGAASVHGTVPFTLCAHRLLCAELHAAVHGCLCRRLQIHPIQRTHSERARYDHMKFEKFGIFFSSSSTQKKLVYAMCSATRRFLLYKLRREKKSNQTSSALPIQSSILLSFLKPANLQAAS